MDCKELDVLIGSLRKKVVKGSKPTRSGRLRSCLRLLDPQKTSAIGKSSLDENVGSTIMKQIKSGLSMIDYLSLGIKNAHGMGAADGVIGSHATGPGVQFDVRGHWKGRVIVRLAASDTYTLIFGRIRGSKWKIDKELSGIYADSLGSVVRDHVLGTRIRKEDTEIIMNLSDAITRFRSISEANTPAPAVNRSTPAGKQISSKSNFGNGDKNKNYTGKAASVPADKEAMAAATNSTAGVSGPGYNGSGREKVDVRAEHVWGEDEKGDLLFAESMLNDRVGYFPSMDETLAEQNMAAPAVSRDTPGGKQTSSKSRFRKPGGNGKKNYDGKPASIPSDKEAMDAAVNSTDGVDGEGYSADGREEIDVRGE